MAILLSDQADVSHELNIERLLKLAELARPRALAAKRAGSVLESLQEVEITLVDDDTIARVHGEFMEDPTPTDVITFHHGEILISVETAERQAAEYGRSWQDEVSLYIVHGLLHLAGYLDKTPEDFKCMAAAQERILAECLAELAQTDD